MAAEEADGGAQAGVAEADQDEALVPGWHSCSGTGLENAGHSRKR